MLFQNGLINISRWFEISGFSRDNLANESKKLNFKGCVFGIKRYIIDLLFKGYEENTFIINKIFKFIAKMKYKVRPKRNFPRISYKPGKDWGVGRNTIINACLTE